MTTEPRSSASCFAAERSFTISKPPAKSAPDRRIVVAVIRLEQFYPFPRESSKEIFASYPNAKEIVWTQEEPQNMGGWTFVENRI